MEKVTVSDKDLPNQNEDNKYEPFIFELKPELHYEHNKATNGSSSSTSSYTDSEDDDDFIQLDNISFTSSFPNPPLNHEPGAIPRKNPNSDQSLNTPTLQPVCSASPVETTNVSNMWPPQSTNRIPASVFTTQLKVPMEWSVASAESLFSLNTSNSSFSKENESVNVVPSDLSMPTTPGSAISATTDVSLQVLAVLEETAESANDEVVKDGGVELGTYSDKLVDVSGANSHRSNGSIGSLQSFAFPLPTGDEITESIKGKSKQQPQPEPQALSTSQSLLVEHKYEIKSEPRPELFLSSSSDLTPQPPQPQVMVAPHKEETIAVTNTTTARNENSNAQEATKTSTRTNMGSGSLCSCCSFGS